MNARLNSPLSKRPGELPGVLERTNSQGRGTAVPARRRPDAREAAVRIMEQSTDQTGRATGELPVPDFATPEDVQLAVKAVVVHAPEEWPAGPLCRNDGVPYPCRLHRWGRRVLEKHGLSERQIDALVTNGNPFVRVPFPFPSYRTEKLAHRA
jgi:hypothetical protein